MAQALPYLAAEKIEAVQGQTWEWSYFLTDADGDPVDLTTGFTGNLSIRVENSAGDVLPVAVTFPAPGEVTCTADVADTDVTPGLYLHELTLTRTVDSVQIIAVGAGDSRFKVKPKVTI